MTPVTANLDVGFNFPDPGRVTGPTLIYKVENS